MPEKVECCLFSAKLFCSPGSHKISLFKELCRLDALSFHIKRSSSKEIDIRVYFSSADDTVVVNLMSYLVRNYCLVREFCNFEIVYDDYHMSMLRNKSRIVVPNNLDYDPKKLSIVEDEFMFKDANVTYENISTTSGILNSMFNLIFFYRSSNLKIFLI